MTRPATGFSAPVSPTASTRPRRDCHSLGVCQGAGCADCPDTRRAPRSIDQAWPTGAALYDGACRPLGPIDLRPASARPASAAPGPSGALAAAAGALGAWLQAWARQHGHGGRP